MPDGKEEKKQSERAGYRSDTLADETQEPPIDPPLLFTQSTRATLDAILAEDDRDLEEKHQASIANRALICQLKDSSLSPDLEAHGSTPTDPEAQPQELVGAFGVRPGLNGRLEVRPARCSGTGGEEVETSATLPRGASAASVTPVANAIKVSDQLRNAEEIGRRAVLENAATAEVIVAQVFNKKNFQMPTFPASNEARFQAEHSRLLLSALKVIRPFAMALNMSFFLWYIIQPDIPLLTTLLVHFLMLLVFYVVSCLTQRAPVDRVQPLMCLSFLIISTQLSIGMYLIPDGFVMAAGGFGGILVPGSCALRFRYAIGLCLGSIVMGNAFCILASAVDNTSYELYFVLIHLNMFLGVYCCFGMVFSYLIELHFRRRFEESGTIFAWTNHPTPTAQESSLLDGTSDPNLVEDVQG